MGRKMSVEALEWKRPKGADGSGLWRGVGGLEPHKNFSILSFEMLNFYAFWTMEQGHSTANVITMFMTD